MTGSSDLDHADSLAPGTIQAQESLESFPRELKVASLYLALSAQRSSFNLVVNDVYLFMKDRYFVGEVLQACLEGKSWSNCTILQVCEPSVKEVEDYNLTVTNSIEEVKLFPPACLYKYRVQKFCSYNDINRVFEAGASHIRRKKRQITKGKLRLFLKQCLVLDSRGIWIVEEKMLQNLGIHGLKFSDIFVGSPPKFPAKYEKVAKKQKKTLPKNFIEQSAHGSTKKEGVKKAKINNKSPRRDKNNPVPAIDGMIDFNMFCRSTDAASSLNSCRVICHRLPKIDDKRKIVKKVRKKYAKPEGEKENEGVRKKYAALKGMTPEERQKRKEKRKRALLDKLKRKEERKKEKEERKEKKIQMTFLKKNHNLLREDLECEDLKPLPVPHAVQCSNIPNELFGDFMMIVEFFHCFKSMIKIKNYFPRGITYEQLETILIDNCLDGGLSNIVILLLTSLFQMQGDENETAEGDNGLLEIDNEELSDMPTSEAIRLAAAEYGSQLYHAAFASDFTLNYLTVTEVLRLHLRSCGGIRGFPSNTRDSSADPGDPASILLKRHPLLLNELCDFHVSELPLTKKISIICCLVDQILSCPSIREELEKRGEELRLRKIEIRAIKAAEGKRTKEAEAQRIREKKEAKLKLKQQNNGGVVTNNEIEAVRDEVEPIEKELRSTRKFQEMYSELRSMSMMFNLAPVGYDRAHRRYWIFSSLPGLFVEHHPFEIGPCLLKPTPRESQSPRNDGKWQARKNSPHKSPNKKDSCILSPGRKMDFGANNSGHVRSVSWICTSNVNCPVHGQGEPRSKWFYFQREEEITALLENLNWRGIRENQLWKFISRDEQWVRDSISKCPMNFIDSSLTPENNQNASNKNENSIVSEELSSCATLEFLLRDRILDIENKISSGCLGSLDVNDPNAWREAIENGEYDMQCDKLFWGMCNDPKKKSDSKICDTDDGDKYDTDNVLGDVDVANGEFVITKESLLSLHPPQMKSKDMLNNRVLEEKNGQNVRSNPCRSQRISQENNAMEIPTPTTAIDPVKVKYSTRNLSCAILQLEQSVDIKYIRKPLVEESDSEDDKLYQLKRWETSLMTALSFSQLFLHLSILDSSIHWSKSVVNTRCVGCRKRGDAEKMLLCDGCNRGTHIFCLKPKLTKVPDGDWFCPKCEPELKKNQTDKKRKSLNIEPAGKEYEKRPSKSRKIVHNDVCESCGLRYNLILCSSCPLAFHPICVVPPLKEPPEGLWTCRECESQGVVEAEEKENEANSSRRSSRRKSGPSDLSLNNSLLQDLLSDLMCHRDSWPFLQPVRKAEAPRYHIIVKKPMDFGTMKYKLNRSHYKNNSEFIDDTLLVFANCRMYNENDAEVYKCGARLSEYFKKRCKDLGLHCRD